MKILQVALGKQEDIRDALQTLGEVIYWDWTGRHASFNRDITEIVNTHNPEVIFLQLQTPNIISEETAREISKKAFVINWTGDVRYPCPAWFEKIGRHIGVTLFTNMNDVDYLNNKGVKAGYLQIGFPDKIFTPEGEKIECPEIIFMANYTQGFPLSDYRRNMVGELRRRYGNRFQVYGHSWGNGTHPVSDQNEEAKYYRGCKIAINLSHFEYKRYSSDRIFRLMGAGAFCLSHHYPEIEKEFEVGKHLVTWRNFVELFQKIDYYLENESVRIETARTGCEYVHKNHKWINRINDLKQWIQ